MLRIDKAAPFFFLLVLLLASSQARAGLCGTFLDPISVSADPLSFSYLPASTATQSANVKVSCGLLGLDLLPSVTVSLSAGNSASFAARQMTGSSANLTYNVYSDSGYTTVWGDGSGVTVTQSINGSLLHLGSYDFPAFGRVLAGQYVPSGSYTDHLTVLVSF